MYWGEPDTRDFVAVKATNDRVGARAVNRTRTPPRVIRFSGLCPKRLWFDKLTTNGAINQPFAPSRCHRHRIEGSLSKGNSHDRATSCAKLSDGDTAEGRPSPLDIPVRGPGVLPEELLPGFAALALKI